VLGAAVLCKPAVFSAGNGLCGEGLCDDGFVVAVPSVAVSGIEALRCGVSVTSNRCDGHRDAGDVHHSEPLALSNTPCSASEKATTTASRSQRSSCASVIPR
jgi:hypothetical protein